jgi:hypothetical protein
MNFRRRLVLFGTVAATASMGDVALANADSYIDYGTDQTTCKAAAQQANATGRRNSFCYETGPGHYSLDLAN